MLMTLFTLMTLVTDEFRDSLENLIDSLVIFSTANIFTVDLRDWLGIWTELSPPKPLGQCNQKMLL